MVNFLSETQKYIFKKGLSYSLFALYAVPFFVMALISIGLGMEVYDIFTDPTEGFKNYPFGTEQGYNYRSKEVYFATTIDKFFMLVQVIFSSFLLYRCNQKIAAIIILILPFVVGYYVSSQYGGGFN
jgi:hypothetical protein